MSPVRDSTPSFSLRLAAGSDGGVNGGGNPNFTLTRTSLQPNGNPAGVPNQRLVEGDTHEIDVELVVDGTVEHTFKFKITVN